MVYFDTPGSFFAGFQEAFQTVRSQILKLETKQIYDESGNESFDLWQKGEERLAIELLPKVKLGEIPLYQDQARRGIEFVRCRPIIFPLSNYLRWEIHCYDFNSSQGEKIFFLDNNRNLELLEYATHDFMVFDSLIAFVHDYDQNGLIHGGWISKDERIINDLTSLYALIRARSINYKAFLSEYSS